MALPPTSSTYLGKILNTVCQVFTSDSIKNAFLAFRGIRWTEKENGLSSLRLTLRYHLDGASLFSSESPFRKGRDLHQNPPQIG
jgi:hypothetical protein